MKYSAYQDGYNAAMGGKQYKPSHYPHHERADYADGWDRGARDRASLEGMQ